MTARVDEGNRSPSASGVTAGNDFTGTEEDRKEKASAPILQAIKRAETAFREWDDTCHAIDSLYSRSGASYERLLEIAGGSDWRDAEMDLFWSSSEVLKPAIYARPPIPVVSPMFTDGGKVKATTAEVLERAALSTFRRTGIQDVMEHVRDDLIFAGRGVMWLRYESEGGKRVCVEHLDRDDFRHEPARKWSEVGWVAGGFWLSRDEIKDRFKSLTNEQLDEIKFMERREKDRRSGDEGMSSKARVWEVWHRANNRVYWVTDGLDVYLEDDRPHLSLDGFFPCPRPAYGTLQRRTLIPVPDFQRYAGMFAKINTLTARIYLLLDQVKMKGVIPGGGDVATAIEQLMKADDDSLLIAVPGAALMEGAAAVVWLPLDQIAAAITGLIEARRQLIEDFYQLSGISDIMRGATEAEETLGAQRLKAQFGSVRVRCKIDELQRVAADAVKIASEIIAEHFDGTTLLDMAQMELPTRKDIEKRIKEIENGAEKELKALGKRGEEMVAQAQRSGQQVDPQQAQQMLQQAQQEIISKYAGMLEEAQNLVPIDDVLDLLKDQKARGFAFEIETDSTVLTDEAAEKQARTEFVGAFNAAVQGLMGLAAMGEPGARLAGEMLKFSMAPYRVGRQMTAAIDAFVEAAPGMIAAQQGQGGDEGMAGIAEAEKMKAEAAMERVKAQREADQGKAALNQAEMQRKMGEMAQKAASDERKFEAEVEKLRQSASDSDAKLAKTEAEIDHLRAQTAEILHSIGLDERKQGLEEYRAAADQVNREVDRAESAEDKAVDREFRERGEARADQQLQAGEV